AAGRMPAALSAFTNSLAADPAGLWRLSLAGGDPAAGRKLFAERADWGCQRCHRLHGEGGDVGPDLTGLAKTRGAEYVLEAILHPNKDIAPGYENVVITRKSGGALAGVLKSETATELVLDVPEDGRMTIPKADIADRQRGLSSMVEGLGELITPREMRDLIAALAE
ncbi:MAG: c-type cytochrome, partial [Limisphaerales bacterium]